MLLVGKGLIGASLANLILHFNRGLLDLGKEVNNGDFLRDQ